MNYEKINEVLMRILENRGEFKIIPKTEIQKKEGVNNAMCN